MSGTAIEIHDLFFSYGEIPVLEKIELVVPEGEFLGIVGPNAGGKSTLLKLILGLLEPQRGEIRVLGRAPRQARRLMGYVPQYPAFSRDFPVTVEQVVLMGRLGTGRLVGGYSRRKDGRCAVGPAPAHAGGPRPGLRTPHPAAGRTHRQHRHAG